MQRYDITGMSCAACASHVEKAVAAVPGVASVAVSLLTNLIKETGKDILGTKAQKYDFFPILIKLIDAKDNL